MRKSLMGIVAALVPLVAVADDVSSLGTPVDLTALSASADDKVERLFEPVGLSRADDGKRNRFYVAPIVGASWGQMLIPGTGEVLRGNLFTGGGAIGMAIARPTGQWRTEIEARYRDGFQRSFQIDPMVSGQVGATDNWSTLLNVWRDVPITENFGGYLGGGIGMGGYRTLLNATDGADVLAANQQDAVFAWQFGFGFIQSVSDRITLDLGYRYYSVDATASQLYLNGSPVPAAVPSQFVANELLFTIRIYEPFRRWR